MIKCSKNNPVFKQGKLSPITEMWCCCFCSGVFMMDCIPGAYLPPTGLECEALDFWLNSYFKSDLLLLLSPKWIFFLFFFFTHTHRFTNSYGTQKINILESLFCNVIEWELVHSKTKTHRNGSYHTVAWSQEQFKVIIHWRSSLVLLGIFVKDVALAHVWVKKKNNKVIS